MSGCLTPCQFPSHIHYRLDEFYPPSPHEQSMLNQPFTSRLRTKESFERMQGFMEQADTKGRLVYRGEKDKGKLRMGFSLVLLGEDGRGESGALVEEEIFGPVLPIIPYSVGHRVRSRSCTDDFGQSLDAAIEYINNGPDPLALYVCCSKKAVWNQGTRTYLYPHSRVDWFAPSHCGNKERLMYQE